MDYTPRTAIGSFFYTVALFLYWALVVPFIYVWDKFKQIKSDWDHELKVLDYRKYNIMTFPRNKIISYEYKEGKLYLQTPEGHIIVYNTSKADYKLFTSVMYGHKGCYKAREEWLQRNNKGEQ